MCFIHDQWNIIRNKYILNSADIRDHALISRRSDNHSSRQLTSLLHLLYLLPDLFRCNICKYICSRQKLRHNVLRFQIQQAYCMADRFVTVSSHQNPCVLRCTCKECCQYPTGRTIHHHICLLCAVESSHLLQTVLHEQLRFMKVVQPFRLRKIPAE